LFKQQLKNTQEQKKTTTADSYVGGITVSWNVTLYRMEERHQHFRESNCLNLQGATVSHAGEESVQLERKE
jgi:hypothetical protein